MVNGAAELDNRSQEQMAPGWLVLNITPVKIPADRRREQQRKKGQLLNKRRAREGRRGAAAQTPRHRVRDERRSVSFCSDITQDERCISSTCFFFLLGHTKVTQTAFSRLPELRGLAAFPSTLPSASSGCAPTLSYDESEETTLQLTEHEL